jgi:hypothetical protein
MEICQDQKRRRRKPALSALSAFAGAEVPKARNGATALTCLQRRRFLASASNFPTLVYIDTHQKVI